MPANPRIALLDLIATLSFKLGDFTLASGQRSDYYIDCRTTTLHAEGGRLAGLVFYDLIRQHIPHAVAVGGLTLGADPLVSDTASASAWALADYHEILTLSAALQRDDPSSPIPTPAPSPPSSTASSSARPRRPTAPAAASKASSIPARPSSSSMMSAPPAAPPSPPSKRPVKPA